ncbi:MAG: CheR family methyltransferase [Clostridia bacterium]
MTRGLHDVDPAGPAPTRGVAQPDLSRRATTVDPDPRLLFLSEALGLPVAAYKPDQLLRRLDNFLRVEGCTTWEELPRRMTQDPRLRRRLQHHLTIHVTSFFRDPGQWERMRALVSASPSRPVWRVWSVAASTGAEALSVAALFDALGLHCTILATDIDAEVLAYAREGRYTSAEVAGLPLPARSRLFEAAGDVWRVQPEVLARITYRPLDLLQSQYPPGPFDLILCRNVLIYWHQPERDRVVARLVPHLAPDGVLFLGATEMLLNADALGLVAAGPSLYRRAAPIAAPS